MVVIETLETWLTAVMREARVFGLLGSAGRIHAARSNAENASRIPHLVFFRFISRRMRPDGHRAQGITLRLILV